MIVNGIPNRMMKILMSMKNLLTNTYVILMVEKILDDSKVKVKTNETCSKSIWINIFQLRQYLIDIILRVTL
jgi:heme-binding NEAT domain protein